MLDDILDRANTLPLAAAVRTELETASGKLDLAYAAVTSGTLFTNVGAIKTKTDALPAEFLVAGDIPTAAEIRIEMDTNSTRLEDIDGNVVDIAEATAPAGTLTTNVGAIKAKTDNLPVEPAAVEDIPTPATIASQVLSSAAPGAFGAGTVGNLIGNLSAIKTKTDLIPAVGGITEIEMTSLLEDLRLAELMSEAVTTPAAGSWFAHLLEPASGTWRFKATALAVAPGSEGVEIDVQSVVDGILNEATAEHVAAGTVGKKIHDQANLTTGQIRDAMWLASPATYGLVPDTYGWLLDARVSGMLPNMGGTGSVEFVYTVTNSLNSQPIPDVIVTATSDEEGQVVIARARTDSSGEATFHLDPGTYYIFRSKTGWNFTNPDEEVVA